MIENQIRDSIKDVEPGKSIFIEKLKKDKQIIQNQVILSFRQAGFGVAGGRYCTGPPGRAPSLYKNNIQFPDYPPDGESGPLNIRTIRSFKPVKPKIKTDQDPVLNGRTRTKKRTSQRMLKEALTDRLNTEYQAFINNKNQFFTNINFFKIMKKQILILAFFTLALIAGSSSAFGQLVTSNIAPAPSVCTSDALHPVAGQSYPYTIDNTNGVVPTDYSWWITKNPQFVVPVTGAMDQSSKLIVAAGQLIATTALGAADGKTINITWSPEILAKTKYQTAPNIAATAAAPSPTFVAVMANGACNNNLQVYEINPKPSFTVDITNILPTGPNTTQTYGTDVPQCVDKVRGATYAATEVVMDYGTNTLFYEVISANFVTSWTPTFTIVAGSLNASQTADVIWYPTKADALAGTNPIETHLAQVDGATIAGGTALTTAVANTSVGVSVYAKVIVHNNKYETIADNPFTLAVDGIDSTNQWDLVNATCIDPAAADQNDKSTQTITRRPDVTNAIAPAPAPNPNTFIPKN